MWQDIKNIFHLAEALYGHLYYRLPSRKLVVIGVTGTSGKTTTAHMIYEVLKTAGYNVSLLSTIKAVIGGKEFDTGFHVTTPGRHRIARHLQEAVNSGDTHFVMEVSSHALHQNRVRFIDFSIGVLTTLAHEHLDYHKTFLNYAKAKFILLHRANKVVVPADGLSDDIKNAVEYKKILHKLITFGLDNGDVNQKDWKLNLKIPGDFNIKNALAAAAVGKLLRIDESVIKRSLESFSLLEGRFEQVSNKKGFRVIIDFAHKPDALEEVLQATRVEIKNKARIIVMFGSASERDVLKRPMMGEIADRLADIIVLTDEDPRFEDPMKIIHEIESGIRNQESRIKNKTLFKIPNRKEAIEFVLRNLAKKGDIVLLLGKGHEKSMNYKGNEMPWSEHEVVRGALES